MQETKTQPAIITKTIARAVEMLNASGAQFKVISPDGTEFGKLEVLAEKQKTFRFKRGEIRMIYSSALESLKVGEVATIKNPDPTKYDVEDIRGSAAAWAGKNWGNDAHTSRIDRDFNLVEILRVK